MSRPNETRREERRDTECRATARVALSVQVMDASLNGLRARISVPLPVGTTLKMQLPGSVERHARIAWSEEGVVGCEFLAPLRSGELGRLLAATSIAAPLAVIA